MDRPQVVFNGRVAVREAVGARTAHGLPGAPVVDEAGGFIGVVAKGQLEPAARGAADTSIGQHLLDPTPPTLNLADRLSSALERLVESGRTWLPVLDDERRIAGVVTVSSVVRRYRSDRRTRTEKHDAGAS